jgi:hypothetical protein
MTRDETRVRTINFEVVAPGIDVRATPGGGNTKLIKRAVTQQEKTVCGLYSTYTLSLNRRGDMAAMLPHIVTATY